MKRNERRDFLRMAVKWAALAGAGSFLPSVFNGCNTLENVARVGPGIGGVISPANVNSLVKTTKAVTKTFEDITPEQEYYIGRSIGAVILAKYPVDTNETANRYINRIGQTLALASDLPETFGGYHFLIQNSKEINALAAPGGLIFVTRGILECCPNETAVAAVLAHEIGHVQFRHGLRAIKQSRITNALVTIGIESAKTFGPAELAGLTRDFGGCIDDITQTLITSGYSRSLEFDADKAAVTILQRVGYNPAGLVEMLQVMKQRLVPNRADFAGTHPSPESRIVELTEILGPVEPVVEIKERRKRFEAALNKA